VYVVSVEGKPSVERKCLEEGQRIGGGSCPEEIVGELRVVDEDSTEGREKGRGMEFGEAGVTSH
jgi:hypothetical protein